jgi:hypothetical protein
VSIKTKKKKKEDVEGKKEKRTNYKEFFTFKTTHLRNLSKSTIFSTIDATILHGTIVKTTCSHKNN